MSIDLFIISYNIFKKSQKTPYRHYSPSEKNHRNFLIHNESNVKNALFWEGTVKHGYTIKKSEFWFWIRTESLAVNHPVQGSSPDRGAKIFSAELNCPLVDTKAREDGSRGSAISACHKGF